MSNKKSNKKRMQQKNQIFIKLSHYQIPITFWKIARFLIWIRSVGVLNYLAPSGRYIIVLIFEIISFITALKMCYKSYVKNQGIIYWFSDIFLFDFIRGRRISIRDLFWVWFIHLLIFFFYFILWWEVMLVRTHQNYLHNFSFQWKRKTICVKNKIYDYMILFKFKKDAKIHNNSVFHIIYIITSMKHWRYFWNWKSFATLLTRYKFKRKKDSSHLSLLNTYLKNSGKIASEFSFQAQHSIENVTK